MKKEFGLYLHIPFCEQKCNYCDFLSMVKKEEEKEQYVQSMIKEIESYKKRMEGYEVSSVFIGGGTPSCLKAEQIGRIMNHVQQAFVIKKAAEITIEINPGTISEEKLKTYKQVGVNRLSFGLQSVHEKELQLLGRIHSFETFVENYNLARNLGFDNINIDLMSALPNQTLEGWKDTLTKVIQLKPEHISAYSLIIEEGTPFYNWYGQGQAKEKELPKEETDRKMYELTGTILEEAGYERYEISNYSKRGYECKHNILYWRVKEYLGIGLGAASYLNGCRLKNEVDLEAYCNKSRMNENLVIETIETTTQNPIEEVMFLGLRLMEGVSKLEFEQRFGIKMDEIYKNTIQKCKKEGLLIEKQDCIVLSKKGIDLSNYVMAEFLL